MSIQDAQNFLNKIKTDKLLAKKIVKAKSNLQRIKIAKKMGFYFTQGEINQIKLELSDEELSCIAGAGGTYWGITE